jgi:hypothetical protein
VRGHTEEDGGRDCESCVAVARIGEQEPRSLVSTRASRRDHLHGGLGVFRSKWLQLAVRSWVDWNPRRAGGMFGLEAVYNSCKNPAWLLDALSAAHCRFTDLPVFYTGSRKGLRPGHGVHLFLARGLAVAISDMVMQLKVFLSGRITRKGFASQHSASCHYASLCC